MALPMPAPSAKPKAIHRPSFDSLSSTNGSAMGFNLTSPLAYAKRMRPEPALLRAAGFTSRRPYHLPVQVGCAPAKRERAETIWKADTDSTSGAARPAATPYHLLDQVGRVVPGAPKFNQVGRVDGGPFTFPIHPVGTVLSGRRLQCAGVSRLCVLFRGKHGGLRLQLPTRPILTGGSLQKATAENPVRPLQPSLQRDAQSNTTDPDHAVRQVSARHP